MGPPARTVGTRRRVYYHAGENEGQRSTRGEPMTEDQWAACKNPALMVDFLCGKTSERKLRLLAVAFCRRFIPKMRRGIEEALHALEVAERFADGLATEAELETEG